MGGPIVPDRLWFYGSLRNSACKTTAWPASSYRTVSRRWTTIFVEAYTGRLTLQLTRVTRNSRRPTRTIRAGADTGGIETGLVAPEATGLNENDNAFFTQTKWTSTVTNKLLFELGMCHLPLQLLDQLSSRGAPRDGVKVAFTSCKPARTTATSKSVAITNNAYRTVAALRDFNDYFPKTNIVSSLSHVTGSHAFKVGLQWGWGKLESWRWTNGDIIQRYRNSVANQVQIKNTPTFAVTNLDADVGVYRPGHLDHPTTDAEPGRALRMVQQLNPGAIGAHQLVPARQFDAIPNVPNWKNWAPRIGAAYDVFGDAKMAIKGSAGEYLRRGTGIRHHLQSGGGVDGHAQLDRLEQRRHRAGERDWTR